MPAPSVTNRFFTSWHWLWAFNTDVLGSRPMRAVPISWIVRPGGLSSTNGVTSLSPAPNQLRGDRSREGGRVGRPHTADPLPVERQRAQAAKGHVGQRGGDARGGGGQGRHAVRGRQSARPHDPRDGDRPHGTRSQNDGC